MINSLLSSGHSVLLWRFPRLGLPSVVSNGLKWGHHTLTLGAEIKFPPKTAPTCTLIVHCVVCLVYSYFHICVRKASKSISNFIGSGVVMLLRSNPELWCHFRKNVCAAGVHLDCGIGSPNFRYFSGVPVLLSLKFLQMQPHLSVTLVRWASIENSTVLAKYTSVWIVKWHSFVRQ